MQVPIFDVRRQHLPVKEQITAAINEVVDDGVFILGRNVQDFEKEFADFCGSKHSVGVSSGSDALVMALEALGIGSGGEVISVPNTHVSTIDSICHVGATPVFVDTEEETQNMDVEKLEGAITEKTKAIIPVHIFGQTAEMNPITDLAERHGLYIIEDASQSHGAAYLGRKSGSFGHVGCFSFHPLKNLGAFGDAGAVTTNDGEIAERIRLARNFGQAEKYRHKKIGHNRRLDEIQAAVLRVKLKYLEEWNESRRKAANLYNELLKSVVKPAELAGNRHVYHLYVVRSRKRDGLKEHLERNGVQTQINYPIPVHLQESYSHMKTSRMPVAEKLSGEILSLPMFPGIEEREIEYVAGRVNEFSAN